MRASEPVARRGTHHHQQQTPNTANTAPYYSKLSKSRTQNSHSPKPATSSGSSNTPAYLQHSALQPQTLHPLVESFLDCFTWNNMTPYVIQGLYYFLRHKILWKTTFWPIFGALVFVICAILILLPLAFIPQAIVLSTVMTPFLGWPLALLLALLELLLVVMIFSAVVLLPITDKLFDEVLILRGHRELVEADNNSACCGCCSIVSFMHLALSIITLPLNLIPVVGTVLWLFINGRNYTWDSHSHYHKELKGRNFRAQRKFVRSHWYGYHMFGMQAMALELIPLANVMFVFTNTVGAALWAADFEDKLLQENSNDDDNKDDTEKPSITTTAISDGNSGVNNSSLSHPTEETKLPVDPSKETYGA